MRAIALLLGLTLLPQATINVNVKLQQIVVTVNDAQGNLVKNLKADDFILEEDGVPQAITHFVQDNDTPASLCLLVDVSGSMATTPSGSLSALRAAQGTARLLMHLMKPQDEFCLMSFSDSVNVEQAFTPSTEKIERALANLHTRGGTDLMEGVEKGLRETRKGKHRKKALIVITDGIAGLDLRRLQRAIAESEVVIYSFALQPIARAGVFPIPAQNDVLRVMAAESGGRSMLFEMHSDEVVNRMVTFVQDIAAELRGQYLIGYYPSGAAGRQVIRIRTKSPAYKARYQREAIPLP